MKIYGMENLKASGNENSPNVIDKDTDPYSTKCKALPTIKTNGISISSCGQPLSSDDLNQYKLKLSADAIQWEEEYHKIKKEKKASEQEIQELRSLVCKLKKKNSELENRLKMHGLVIDEENFALHRKLSKVSSKYYSYPWTDALNKSLQFSLSDPVYQPTERDVQENLEEVSKKLLNQMKQEMKELHELDQRLKMEKSSLNPDLSVRNDDREDYDLENNILENMSIFKIEMKFLKQHLENQKTKLKILTNVAFHDDESTIPPPSDVMDHTEWPVASNIHESTRLSNISKGKALELEDKQFVRPSDESFRAYFTQQLNNSKSAEELRKVMEFYLQVDKRYSGKKHKKKVSHCKPRSVMCSSTSEIPSKQLLVDSGSHSGQDINRNTLSQSQKLVKDAVIKSQVTEEVKPPFPEEERICPICEAVFPKVISQKEFESHVVAHLEAESASILNQYEIL